MERILGLDLGDKTIGVAISDPLQLTAQSLTTIERIGRKKDFRALEEIIKEYDVKKIVLGLPINMNGSLGPQGEKTKIFGERIKNRFGIDPIYVDERLTTVSAERILIEADMRRENRRKVIDKVAASYILQTYLDGKGREI